VWHVLLMSASRRVGSCIGQNCDPKCSPISDTLSFSEVKAHLSELADRVECQHDRILVTRNGRPSFVLLSPDDLESSKSPSTS
jgi:prevent-host-death family protein